MAATRTPEKYPEVSENGPSGTCKVHPKICYLGVTDYIYTYIYIYINSLSELWGLWELLGLWELWGFRSFGSFPGRWEQIWFVTTARIGSSHGLEIPQIAGGSTMELLELWGLWELWELPRPVGANLVRHHRSHRQLSWLRNPIDSWGVAAGFLSTGVLLRCDADAWGVRWGGWGGVVGVG